MGFPLRRKPAVPPLRPQGRFASLARRPCGPPWTPEPLRPLGTGLRAGQWPAPALCAARETKTQCRFATDLSTHGCSRRASFLSETATRVLRVAAVLGAGFRGEAPSPVTDRAPNGF